MHGTSSSPLRVGLSLGIALAAACLFGRDARADALITFDDLSANVAVDTQYVGSGVKFNGAARSGTHILSGLVTPFTGPNVLVNAPVDEEFSGGPLSGTFITPQRSVQLYASYYVTRSSPPTRQGTLRGFDANGNLVVTDGPKTVNGGITSTQFSIVSSQANIASFTIDLGAGVYTVIDNLQIAGGAVIPPPPSPPEVVVSDPSGVVDAVASGLLVNGIVYGEGLLPEVKVVIELQTLPPIPGFPNTVLTGNLPLIAPNNNFQNRTVFRNLLMGVYKITVTATNVAGQTGVGSRTFTVLADSISRTPGFRYAQPAGNCQIAVFDGLAVAIFPSTGAAINVPSIIMNEWLKIRNYSILRGDGLLGCPIAQSTPNLNVPPPSKRIPNLFTQDFERGRLYVIAGGKATYTPRVFADAITTVSTYADPGAPQAIVDFDDPIGTTEVGIPTDNPVMDGFGTDPTWLFQRFARPGYGGPANTIELRGPNPTPKLYIERIGGAMADYVAAVGHPPVVDDVTPTLWETYDCHFDTAIGQFRCSVTHQHVVATARVSGKPMYTTQGLIDRVDDFCPPSVGGKGVFVPNRGANSWSSVPLKSNDALDQEPSLSDYSPVVTRGWINASNQSSEDLSTVHFHNHCAHETTHDFIEVLGCASVPVVGCDYGSAGGDALGGCWSDYIMHIRPLNLAIPDPNAAFLRIPSTAATPPPYWSLLAAQADPQIEGTDHAPPVGDMEIEWEATWQNQWLDILGNHVPQKGGLAIVQGRWIVDCGHPPYHAEVHPIHGIILLESAPPPPELAGAPDGKVTRAQVWVNEFYTGFPFGAQISAPPRPSPDAQLNALYTVINAPANGITFRPDGSVMTQFTNFPVGPNHMVSPTSSQVSLFLRADGTFASFSGTNDARHAIAGTGQAFLPRDDPEGASGPVGRLFAQWFVGWSQ